MTDTKIKKALECCSSGNYGCENGCPLDKECDSPIRGSEKIMKSALDLINRLQAGCENYKQVAEYQQSITLDRGFEIKRLKENVESLQRQLHNAKLHQKETHKALQDEKVLRLNEDFIKAEAYKEFAERLKMRAINRYNEFEDYQAYPYATIEHIDNLLKELVGEDK